MRVTNFYLDIRCRMAKVLSTLIVHQIEMLVPEPQVRTASSKRLFSGLRLNLVANALAVVGPWQDARELPVLNSGNSSAKHF